MAGKQLTSQNATITTVEVKLSTLTVSGKQVTLAVFRQLPEEPLIAEDGTLNGVPWGYVNYHPDKCADNAPHWHVVWQRGEELLRSAVEKSPRLDGRRWANIHECDGCFESDEADRYINAAVRQWVAGEASDDPLRNPDDKYWSLKATAVIHLIAQGITVHAEPSAAARAAWAAKTKAHVHDTARAFKLHDQISISSAASGTVDATLAALEAEFGGGGFSFTQVNRDLHEAVRREVDRRQRHLDALKALADLPQLYIAV